MSQIKLMYDLFLMPSVEQLPPTLEDRQGLKKSHRNTIVKKLTVSHSSKAFIKSIDAYRKKGSGKVS